MLRFSEKALGAALILGTAVFLLAVGLGPGALPYPLDSAYSDAVISHWPNALYMHRNGFALWNPRIYSGLPFAVNPLSKVWYPPQWAVLLLEPTLHLDLMIWLHLAFAGFGMWAWARASGLGVWPAALAAAAYTFAPKTVAHLGAGHLDLLYAMAWFPWLLWAVHTALAAETNRLRAALRLGVVAAFLFLADIRLSAYAFVTTGVYAAWILLKSRRPEPAANHGEGAGPEVAVRPVLPLLGGGVIALALTGVQWIPLLALSPYLSRGAMTPADAAAFSLEPGHLLGVILGHHAGLHETMTYAGLCVVILAALALVAYPRRLAFWALVIIVAALYALGDNGPLWSLLVQAFPPLLWWRIPSRAWFVVALALPYLAGWGVQALAVGWRGSKRARLAVVTLLGSAVMCGALSAVALAGAVGVESALAALVVSLATAAVIGPALAGKLRANHIAPLLLAIVLADLLWIDRTLVEGRGRDYWLDPYQALAEYLRSQDVGRVYTPSDSLPQQAAAYWEINQFGGVDPFQIAGYVAMSRQATRIPYDGYTPTIPPYTGEDPVESMWAGVAPDAALMRLWNVTHVVSAFPIEGAGWRLDRQVGDTFVYRNLTQVENVGVIVLPDGAAAFYRDGRSATLMVSVPWLPGWMSDAGTPAAQGLQALSALPDPGSTMSYVPPADVVGIAVTAAAILVCLLLYWLSRPDNLYRLRNKTDARESIEKTGDG